MKRRAQVGLNRLPNKELGWGSPRPGAGQLTLSRTCLQSSPSNYSKHELFENTTQLKQCIGKERTLWGIFIVEQHFLLVIPLFCTSRKHRVLSFILQLHFEILSYIQV